MTDEQVRLTPLEVGLAVALGQRDRESLVRGAEGGEARRQEPRRPLIRHDPHGRAPVVTERGAAAIDRARGLRHTLRERHQLLAVAREAMTVRSALEQAPAEALLELPQVTRDGRLADAQRVRGTPQAAGLGDGEEDAQIVPLHGTSLVQALRIRSGAHRS